MSVFFLSFLLIYLFIFIFFLLFYFSGEETHSRRYLLPYYLIERHHLCQAPMLVLRLRKSLNVDLSGSRFVGVLTVFFFLFSTFYHLSWWMKERYKRKKR